MRKFALTLALLGSVAAPASAQQYMPNGAPTMGFPITLSDGTRVLVQAVTTVDSSGNPVSGGGGGTATPTGTAGTPSSSVVSVQGVPGGIGIDTVIKSTASDRGAVVGTTSTQLMAANAARRGLSIQVQSASASCYINGIAGATADYHSLQILANSYYESAPTHVGTGAVTIICTAASTSVYAREW